MTIFNVRYTTNGINVYNYDYNYDHMFIFYTKKEYCLSHDHIAYYSGVGGVEIHGVENDYIYCTSSAWYPPKKYHKVKIHYNDNGSDYIIVRGYKVPLNECIRFSTMWG